ncbi:hypothetical protein [Microcoleus sp. PH2017_36_ELK_O_B]|nr:hypothetical protein [Microcoleus sp. PH2017_36_ELK_O_B]
MEAFNFNFCKSVVPELHFTGGESNGSGKSLAAKLLAQWIRDRTLFDAGKDGNLLKIFQSECEAIEPPSSDDLDWAFAALESVRLGRSAVVDLPGGRSKEFARWAASNCIGSAAAESEWGVFLWWVCDGTVESKSALQQSLELAGGELVHILVRNLHFKNYWSGSNSKWEWCGEDWFLERVEAGNLKSIDLPKLTAGHMNWVSRSGVSFLDALSVKDAVGNFEFYAKTRSAVYRFVRDSFDRLSSCSA